MGDGDAYSIGGNHLIHTARKNLDLTCLIMDNRTYGMTRGQTSPTTPLGDRTSTTPYGSIEPPLHPLVLALASGATFAARGVSWEPKARDRFEAMRVAAADGGQWLGIFYQEECPTYWDQWQRQVEAAKTRPLGVRGLDAIVPRIP